MRQVAIIRAMSSPPDWGPRPPDWRTQYEALAGDFGQQADLLTGLAPNLKFSDLRIAQQGVGEIWRKVKRGNDDELKERVQGARKAVQSRGDFFYSAKEQAIGKVEELAETGEVPLADLLEYEKAVTEGTGKLDYHEMDRGRLIRAVTGAFRNDVEAIWRERGWTEPDWPPLSGGRTHSASPPRGGRRQPAHQYTPPKQPELAGGQPKTPAEQLGVKTEGLAMLLNKYENPAAVSRKAYLRDLDLLMREIARGRVDAGELARVCHHLNGLGSEVGQAVSPPPRRPGGPPPVAAEPAEPAGETPWQAFARANGLNAGLGDILRDYARYVGDAAANIEIRRIEKDDAALVKLYGGDIPDADIDRARAFLLAVRQEAQTAKRFPGRTVAVPGGPPQTERIFDIFSILRVSLMERERLDINDPRDFLTWIEAEVRKKFDEDPLSSHAQLSREIAPHVRGLPQPLESILEYLPPHMKAWEVPIKQWLRLLGTAQTRGVEYFKVRGDLEKVVEYFGALDKGGAFTLMRTQEWQTLAGLFGNPGDRREGIEPDRVRFGDRVKIALGRYLMMALVWQDGVVDKASDDNLVPGPKGREALRKLEAQGWKYNWTKEKNIYYKDLVHGRKVGQETIDQQRERIKLWTGGVDPDDLRVIPGSPVYDAKLRKTALLRGNLAETTANNIAEPVGISAWGDTGGAGDEGLNLVVRLREYMIGQARSSRFAAGGTIMKHLRLAVPQYFELFQFEMPGGHIRTLQDLILDPTIKMANIPWNQDYRVPNMDRQWALTLTFFKHVFDYIRGDKRIELSNFAVEEKGGLAKYNPQIADEIKMLWKMCYLWSVVVPLDNRTHQIWCEKRGGRWVYPSLAPIDLAKRVFMAIMEDTVNTYLPEYWFQKVFKSFAPANRREMRSADVAAFTGFLSNGLRKTQYRVTHQKQGDRITGDIVGVASNKPLFSVWEVDSLYFKTGMFLV